MNAILFLDISLIPILNMRLNEKSITLKGQEVHLCNFSMGIQWIVYTKWQYSRIHNSFYIAPLSVPKVEVGQHSCCANLMNLANKELTVTGHTCIPSGIRQYFCFSSLYALFLAAWTMTTLHTFRVIHRNDFFHLLNYLHAHDYFYNKRWLVRHWNGINK